LLYCLRRHLFPVSTHFDYSLVLTFAYPRAVLEPLLSPGLTLDCQGDLAFLAVAMVQTRRLRPSVLPAWLGLDFFLVGYRIFTRYRDARGRNLRGLRILASHTDRRVMVVLGNLMTHYGYHKVEVESQRGSALDLRVRGENANLQVHADLSTHEVSLPENSPFANWREARKFAGPLPFTFDYEGQTHSMIVVEGVREHWEPKPLRVELGEVEFLQGLGERPQLASAFYVEDIPYRWKRGVVEKL
jgi:hypothetical protein